MPDTVTKTDLTNIISFLCKKLDWIEELNETTSAKPSEEKYEKSMSHDHDNSFDSEIINKSPCTCIRIRMYHINLAFI